ncbi:MAG: transglutaminase domain-containing protein [Rhodomicrobium sp.]
MSFRRRDILKAGAVFSAAAAIPSPIWAENAFAPQPGAWRSFQIATKLEILNPVGETQAWVPLPSVNQKEWFRSNSSEWKTNGSATRVRDPKYGAEILHVRWAGAEKAPIAEITSKITVRDRAIDLSSPGEAANLPAAERNLYLEGTELIPVDGVVKQTSDRITAGAKTDVEKAHAIYEWIVENTFRDAAVRGCGIGDIANMLKTGYLGGKCADLNALYAGLARAAGIPARDIYGIRVAPSRFGYRSLGAVSEVITKAQHCRSEVYLAGFGWVPVDPADVRKVALEEPPANLAMNHPKVVAARKALFGSWETNWLAYNFAQDIALPGSNGPRIGFLMYPQAETGGTRLDCLDADNFKYTILSKELTAA